jgi:dienelactone hydrolase
MIRVDEVRDVRVDTGSVTLEGTLEGKFAPAPAAANAVADAEAGDVTGVVLFAHGSGSSRFSSRNRHVAQALRAGGLATLLMDLLTPEEEAVDLRTRHIRFDIPLLAGRLVGAVDWLAKYEATARLPVGLFGASTGAGAALVAAARRPDRVRAVVSRGGRPDLAADALASVSAPTLLIVGGDDEQVAELNESAARTMLAARPAPDVDPEVRIEIIPGATHLFEEPGALEQVATLARDWFARHLGVRLAVRPAVRAGAPRLADRRR